jgi:pimeloyl-ACP methyl ester carboxylesterase
MKTASVFRSQEGKEAVLGRYEELLQQFPQPYASVNVHTRYGATYVMACGDEQAPPLLLLHGGGMNSAMWLEEAASYSSQYRVYLVDIPGEPGRSDENRLPLAGTSYPDWLFDVYSALSIERASLVGISFGAWLAAKFAGYYPERVTALGAISPLGMAPQRSSFLITMMICMLQGTNGLDKLYRKINGDQPIPAVLPAYQKLIGKHSAARKEMIPLLSDSELSRLRMPLVVLAGEQDRILHTGRTVRRVSRLLPQAQIHRTPQAGHTLLGYADLLLTGLVRTN